MGSGFNFCMTFISNMVPRSSSFVGPIGSLGKRCEGCVEGVQWSII